MEKPNALMHRLCAPLASSESAAARLLAPSVARPSNEAARAGQLKGGAFPPSPTVKDWN